MSEEIETAYRQQIEVNPDDRLTQLILADWYEEQGDPRCELIRRNSWGHFLCRERLCNWGLPFEDMLILNLEKTSNVAWEDGTYGLAYQHPKNFGLWHNHVAYDNPSDPTDHDPYGFKIAAYGRNITSYFVTEEYVYEPKFMPPGWIGHLQGSET